MEFKYGRTLREHNFSPKHRPKPSPMKNDIFRKDLGLDDEDDSLPDLSSSSEEEDSDQPSEIEFNILQKELQTCSQQRDALREKYIESQSTVQHLKARLQKEEISKKSRMKIMQRTQADVLKDKQKLINDLQDILDENGDHSNLKLVSSIEQLHREKADLHSDLMVAFEEYETKISEVEDRLRNAATPITNGRKDDVPQEVIEEKEKLERKLEEMQRIQSDEKTRQDKLLQQKEDETKALRQEQERMKRSSDALQSEIHDLKENSKKSEEASQKTIKLLNSQIKSLESEKDKLRRNLESLENESTNHVKDQMNFDRQAQELREENQNLTKEFEKNLKKSEEASQKTIRRLNSQIKSHESEIDELRKNLEALQNESTNHIEDRMNSDRQTQKLREENQNLMKELEKQRRKIDELEHRSADLASSKNAVVEMREENAELEIKLKRVGSSLDRHKAAAKEKLHAAERDLEEARALVVQQRKEANNNYEELKRAMTRNETLLKQEVVEAEEAFNEQKLESEKLIQRLEENLLKSKEKCSKVKEELTEANSTLFSKTTECENVKELLESKEKAIIVTKQRLKEIERNTEQQQLKIEDLQNRIGHLEVEKDNAERQLRIMSGQSNTALAEKVQEAGDLRIQLNAAQNALKAEKRKHDAMSKVASEVQAKCAVLENQLSEEISKHRLVIESMNESHRTEMLKLTKDSKLVTEALNVKATTLQKSIRYIASVLHKLSHENTQLHREVENFPILLKEAIKRTGKQITEALSEVNENSKDLIRRYRKEMKLRKKYHNELVELKGNIRVFVRARPKISEDGLNPKMSVSYDVNDDSLIYVSNQQRGRNQSFDLDRVFSDTSSQQEVYNEVQPLVTSCMDGYHVCIFAYGQTGSGKTYTMEGTQEEPGINQRALSDLFKMVEERSLDWDYSVSVSLVEIYNETLKDLLTTKHEKLEIKMNADGTLFVQRLTILPVKDLNDVNRAFEFGRSNRATASTNMNEHSSRSHAVLMVTVAGTNKTTEVQTIGKLNLIDLAGSERVSKSGASGDRLKEAQNINRSLSALGDVIHSLRNKQSHVPFRNSKLTYLLQDSLSKDSKTLMVVQVSPVEKNSSETICSLTFAQRVRLVELGQATKKTKS